jgi:hypothetical protein
LVGEERVQPGHAPAILPAVPRLPSRNHPPVYSHLGLPRLACCCGSSSFGVLGSIVAWRVGGVAPRRVAPTVRGVIRAATVMATRGRRARGPLDAQPQERSDA